MFIRSPPASRYLSVSFLKERSNRQKEEVLKGFFVTFHGSLLLHEINSHLRIIRMEDHCLFFLLSLYRFPSLLTANTHKKKRKATRLRFFFRPTETNISGQGEAEKKSNVSFMMSRSSDRFMIFILIFSFFLFFVIDENRHQRSLGVTLYFSITAL